MDADQRAIPGLTAEFAPLQRAGISTNNLLAQLTPLIGREREIHTVITLLQREDVRLVTLTGPGGTGKTRLALQIATELLLSFADGVMFVGLAPVADPELVISTVARSLSISEAEGRPLTEHLVDFLGGKELLLLLDNFEQVVEAAPQLARLLAACPRLKLLVTSRTVLRLTGEHAFVVPPLELPDHSQPVPGERLSRYEAIRLFIERAQAVRADFALTDDNAAAVAEICLRLDGLPLAIELAAALIRLLPPPALLARLGNRLQLLTGGPRDLPARQQTLRNTIAWSHDLLTLPEQQLFRRLAVFAGGWTLEAAEQVTRAVERSDGGVRYTTPDTLGLMASLLDKNLIKQAEEEAEPRFTMLEMIREFAWEQLEASGESEAIRDRHAAFCFDVAEKSQSRDHRDYSTSLRRVDADLDNMRAALVWCDEAPERLPQGLRLAAALNTFWESRGHWAEGRSWLDRFLQQAGGADDELVALALLSAGNLAYFQGNQQAARAYLERSLEFWRGRPPGSELAACLRYLARVMSTDGEISLARALCEEDLTIAGQLGLPNEASMAYNVLGGISMIGGDLATAQYHLEQGLSIARGLRHPIGVAVLLAQLGPVAVAQGDLDRARALFEEGLAIGRSYGDRKTAAQSLAGLATVAMLQIDETRAESLAGESLGLFRQMGNQYLIARTLSLLALLKSRLGDDASALRLYDESLAVRGMGGASKALAESMLRLAAPSQAGQYVVEQGAIGSILRLAEHEALKARPARAARLFGALQTVGRMIGRPPSERFRLRVAHLRENLLGQLGEPGFSAAFAEGRALSVEEAVTEALAVAAETGALLSGETPSAIEPAEHAARPGGLTAREVEIIRLIAGGLSNSQIAEQLVVSTRTVERHIENVYGKLGVRGRSARAAVTAYAANHRLLPPARDASA